MNEAAVKILGLADNVRGKYFDDVCAVYDLASNVRINSPIEQALVEKISVELRKISGTKWPGGSITYISATSTPVIGKDGVLRGSSSLFRDITGLRQLEF